MLPKLPTTSVDVVITDQPYGTTALAWDRPIQWAEWWEQINRIAKPTAPVVCFSQQPFTTDLINSNRRAFRYELIWAKTMPVGWLDAKKRPLRAHENILIFCREYRGQRNALKSVYNPQMTQGAPYQRRPGHRRPSAHYGSNVYDGGQRNTGTRYPRSVLSFSNAHGGKSPHPTRKPLDLLQWLVLTYSNRGDLILDPFMGSGSTGEAAKLLDRRFIGIEREAAYFQHCQRVLLN